MINSNEWVANLRSSAVRFDVFDFRGVDTRFTVNLAEKHLLRLSVRKSDTLLLITVDIGFGMNDRRVDSARVGTSLQEDAADCFRPSKSPLLATKEWKTAQQTLSRWTERDSLSYLT